MIIHVCDLCGSRIAENNKQKKIGFPQNLRLINDFGMDVEFEICMGCSDSVTIMFAQMRDEWNENKGDLKPLK